MKIIIPIILLNIFLLFFMFECDEANKRQNEYEFRRDMETIREMKKTLRRMNERLSR